MHPLRVNKDFKTRMATKNRAVLSEHSFHSLLHPAVLLQKTHRLTRMFSLCAELEL